MGRSVSLSLSLSLSYLLVRTCFSVLHHLSYHHYSFIFLIHISLSFIFLRFKVSDISWSPDGQILTIGTYAGNVYNFLAKMSVLNAKFGTTAAFLSSLREISVVDAVKRSAPIDITLKVFLR
jgi:hypothetical protein